MKLKIKKLHPDAVVPQYQTAGAACFDLHACQSESVVDGHDSGMPVEFLDGCTFRTGLSVEVPQGHVLLIFSRSGHGFKYDTRLANCVGVIDSDYRGELMVRLMNDGDEPFIVRKGDRIAQAMIIPIPRVEFEVVKELTATERGTGGFGSTGA